MLLGICGQLKGDTDCFCEVYRELAPSLGARAEVGEESPVIARWRQYLRVASYLVSLGIITLTGTGLAAPTSGLFETNNAPALAKIESIRKTLNADEIKKLPCGVQNIEYNDQGVIFTLMVVVKAAIPKAFRKNPSRASRYGSRYGYGRARETAEREFASFLATKCMWGKTPDGQMVIREAAAESSTFAETEMTQEQKLRFARANAKGVQVLWKGLNDGGEYVWVGVWKADTLITDMETDDDLEPENTEPEVFSKYNMGGRGFEDHVFKDVDWDFK